MLIAANVKFSPDRDPELIAKLQAVAPHCYLKVNPLAKKLLHEKLDEYIRENGITVDYSQPAGVSPVDLTNSGRLQTCRFENKPALAGNDKKENSSVRY